MGIKMSVGIKNVQNRPQIIVVLDNIHLTRASVEFVKILGQIFSFSRRNLKNYACQTMSVTISIIMDFRYFIYPNSYLLTTAKPCINEF